MGNKKNGKQKWGMASVSVLKISVAQATSSLAGLLEEDSIATDESKIIDNASRGAEVGCRKDSRNSLISIWFLGKKMLMHLCAIFYFRLITSFFWHKDKCTRDQLMPL